VADGVADLLDRLRGGEVRALARAISIVEAGGGDAVALLAGCRAVGRRALRVGVTGAPGAGKSTLVDQMARVLRGEGKTVGVVAVDPTSPVTGGALLGDRIRMQGFSGDEGVYIRSLASRGVSGGVGRAAEDVCEVLEAAGKDVVLVETVGVGQDEVGVVGIVDVVVLVLVPGMGDEVQALKAGVMEVADVFCVNKADRGGAERLEAELRDMGREVLVVRTVAATGEGVGELMGVVGAIGAGRRPGGLRPTLSDKAAKDGAPGVSQVIGLDHLGIAVRSLEASRGFYEGLGMVVTGVETVEHEGVRVAMLPVGENRIELLEGLSEESVIGRFVARRGEGLHHVALRVRGIDEVFAGMKERGVRLASDAVRVGAGGHRYFFVHPASTGGVLLELVEGGE
jgi:LAO/AO transport system kinase